MKQAYLGLYFLFARKAVALLDRCPAVDGQETDDLCVIQRSIAIYPRHNLTKPDQHPGLFWVDHVDGPRYVARDGVSVVAMLCTNTIIIPLMIIIASVFSACVGTGGLLRTLIMVHSSLKPLEFVASNLALQGLTGLTSFASYALVGRVYWHSSIIVWAIGGVGSLFGMVVLEKWVVESGFASRILFLDAFLLVASIVLITISECWHLLHGEAIAVLPSV